ncbi:MAG: asparagine synthase (glutamine-hydrolyzing) [Holophagales bacterium]|nr:asparagine synthase (glutamine-hydrolyzing) [Holophagales bacterium]
MCGITGFWQLRRDDAAPSHLTAMMWRLAHRGPDGEGRYTCPEGNLYMGHTRLSIVDLSSGEQPIVDRPHVLTVNGELYDFKRIRARLMAAEGERFQTKSDSEIALGLYRRDGLDFVRELRGEFALALYDSERRELILVRDRFGIRPLFFHLQPGFFAWGSEVKAILAHPDVPVRLDRRAALHQMMQTMVPGSSAFEGVQALEPGHLLIVRQRDDRLEVEKRRYWDLEFPRLQDHDAGERPRDHVDRIREQLIDAVTHRLVADVPVGCYLSGGIDSCSILGLAGGAQQAPVKAFTIGFDDDAYDEQHIAREMAESVGAEQEVILLDADDLYGESFLRTVWHAERSFYNTLGVAKWHMSRRVRECGYKTVITGEGADELLGGYPAFKRDMFLHGLAHESPEVRDRMRGEMERQNALFQGAILPQKSQRHPAFESLVGFTPSWIQNWLSVLDVTRPLLSADTIGEIEDYDPIAAIVDRLDARMIQDRHPLDQAQYTWTKTMLEGQILNWGGDRVDMANSMESRPAFLDHHFAEAAVRVPPKLRIRGTTEKWVLREAMRGILPEVLYERQKFAFMAPPAHTDERKRRRLDGLLGRFLNPETVERTGLFDPGRIRAFLEGYRCETDPVALVRSDAIINHLLCIHVLHEQYVEGSGAVPTGAPTAAHAT